MFNLSNDDSYSTQLEGKRLKNRGAYMESHLLEIEQDGPALMEEVDIEQGQEYFTDRSLGQENEQDRGERLKKEMTAARQSRMDLQKQQQNHKRVEQRIDDPNLKLDEIEQGVMQSQNKGEKTIEKDFKQVNDHAEYKKQQEGDLAKAQDEGLRKTDKAATNALLGKDNYKNLDLSDDKKLAENDKDKNKKSVPANQVEDQRAQQRQQGQGMF